MHLANRLRNRRFRLPYWFLIDSTYINIYVNLKGRSQSRLPRKNGEQARTTTAIATLAMVKPL